MLRTMCRVALGYLAFVSVTLGAWALLAPRSFYDDYPGLGRSWVSIDGPYNEHLVRDVGALNLALTVVFVGAAVTLGRAMIITASIASLVWGIPHFIYHLANLDDLGAGDAFASIAGLAVFALLPIVLIIVSSSLDEADG
ncbi:MAG: hypothetical protein QNM02_06345 [Acidimicrobiia bacterium]|nr:hypothetical protein [Acidimicrobiia bacterium]